MRLKQSVSTLPPKFAGSNLASEILLSADGRFLYVSNRLHSSLALFTVAADGSGSFNAACSIWSRLGGFAPFIAVAFTTILISLIGIPPMVGFMGKQAPAPVAVAVTTTSPERAFTLDTGGVTLAPAAAGDAPAASLALPAEAFLRLIYGRLDDATEVAASGVTLPELKSVFPGF